MAVIPSLFWPEFQQICVKKRYAGQQGQSPLPVSEIRAAYEDVRELPLVEIPRVIEEFRGPAWELRLSLQIDAYDAYYLALACDLALEVWTLDQRFRDRARGDVALAGTVKLVGTDVLA